MRSTCRRGRHTAQRVSAFTAPLVPRHITVSLASTQRLVTRRRPYDSIGLWSYGRVPPLRVCSLLPVPAVRRALEESSRFHALDAARAGASTLSLRVCPGGHAVVSRCRSAHNPRPWIIGSVEDATGAPLPAVTISVQGVENRVTETGPDGRFHLENLPVGEYQLRAAHPGFAPARRTLRLGPGEKLTVTLTLSVLLQEHTVVTAARSGERTCRRSRMAVSVLPATELQRVDVHTVEHLAGLAPSVTFSQNTGFAPADHSRNRHQCRLCRVRPEFRGLSRRGLPGPPGVACSRTSWTSSGSKCSAARRARSTAATSSAAR